MPLFVALLLAFLITVFTICLTAWIVAPPARIEVKAEATAEPKAAAPPQTANLQIALFK